MVLIKSIYHYFITANTVSDHKLVLCHQCIIPRLHYRANIEQMSSKHEACIKHSKHRADIKQTSSRPDGTLPPGSNVGPGLAHCWSHVIGLPITTHPSS